MKYIPLFTGYQILVDAQSPTCYSATLFVNGELASTEQGTTVKATDSTESAAVARCAFKFGTLRERGLI